MRPTFRLVPDFIVPHLNQSTYGNHLHWEDKKTGNFKISRIHQSSEMWNEQCIEVYKAWSLKKKLWKKDDPKNITKAKHRLITALRRNPEVEILKKESTFYRFRLLHPSIADTENSAGEWMTGRTEMDKIGIVKTENTVRSHYDTENILKTSNENIDYSQFSCSETTINSTNYPLSLFELDTAQKLFPTSDILSEDLYSFEPKSTDFSDRCCCDVLLDNYLCNQKCIWHGTQT